MKFLIDAQLPPALCGWLRERGYEAVYVSEIGMIAASDADIAARAEADDAVLVSKDEDFVTLRLLDRFEFRWLRCGIASNRAIMTWLKTRWTQTELLLTAGENFVEARQFIRLLSLDSTRTRKRQCLRTKWHLALLTLKCQGALLLVQGEALWLKLRFRLTHQRVRCW